MGIASEADGKIICTSYSINAHGKELAWKMSVDTFSKHKGIGKGTKLYKELIAAIPKRAIKKTVKKTAKTVVKKPIKKVAKKSAKKVVKKVVKKAVKKQSLKKK